MTDLLSLGRWDDPSFALIEITVLTLAALVVRDALRGDRLRQGSHGETTTTPGSGDGIRLHAGTSDDSTGPWPRTTFLLRAALFTLALEATLSTRVNSIYIDVTADQRTPYSYPDTFLLSAFGVPLWIPIGWAVIFYLAMLTSDRLITLEGFTNASRLRIWRRGALARAFMDGALALSVDFALDPIAQAEGWWTWTLRENQTDFFSIPISNFVAWFAIIFSLSLLTRTSRMFVSSRRPVRSALGRRAFDVALAGLSLVLSFLAVFFLVLFVYRLDARGGVLNPSMLMGGIVVFAALSITNSALPLRRSWPYDKLVARSAIVLHSVFIVVMLGNIVTTPDSDRSFLAVVPHDRADKDGFLIPIESYTITVNAADTATEDGAVAAVEFEGVPDRTGGAMLNFVAIDVRPIARPEQGETLEGPASYQGAANIVVRSETEPLLTRDPELAIWVPTIAAVSLVLFTWPYWDELSSRILSRERRRHWVLEF